MIRKILRFSILLLAAISTAVIMAATVPNRSKLSAFLGHWEGGGKFLQTSMSKAHEVSSETDCAWSPQGQALVCEQTIHDGKVTQHQLTIYQADEKDADFSYTTLTPGRRPFTGVMKIRGDQWIYFGASNSPRQYPEFKTTNTFKDDVESFQTEFTEDGHHWTTMLQGSLRRTSDKAQ